jgi:hypothetical protein
MRPKLTYELVRAARKRYASGGVTVTALADSYGVSISAMSNVLSNTTWQDPRYTPPTTPAEPRRPRAVLDWQKVREIRVTYTETDVTQRALAHAYGVTPKAIGDVVRNLTWIDPAYTPPGAR